LAANNEAHLLQTADCLAEHGIRFELITEPDPPFNGAATAIGVYPVNDRTKLRKTLKRLRLLS